MYHTICNGNEEIGRRSHEERLAEAFARIVRGESTCTLRLAHAQPVADVPDLEAFRPYLNRARTIFRSIYGLPGINEGWVSESLLVQIVKELLPGERVLDHYHPPWLEGLELDIYLPERSLAFEYMGVQHYQPVERFGGAEAFLRVVERDRRKRELCAVRGVRLVDVRHDEPLTIAAIGAKCKRSRKA